eukprot:2872132-Lingulodinium_polyedra.AAC.1
MESGAWLRRSRFCAGVCWCPAALAEKEAPNKYKPKFFTGTRPSRWICSARAEQVANGFSGEAQQP